MPTIRPNRWSVLAVLFLSRTAMGFQFQSVASSAAVLAHALSIDYTEIGTLIGLYTLPGVVIALPGGMLDRRLGDRQICVAGLALMIAGALLFALGASSVAGFAGRLVSGTGAVLFNLVLTKMVADWFAGREIVTAMGVILASWPFGIALALVTQPPLAAHLGWQAVMAATAAFCAVAAVLVMAFYREPPHAAAARQVPASAGATRLWRDMVPASLAGTLWGGFNLGLVVFFSFAPGLLLEHGLTPARASALVSLGLWVSMASVPLGSWLAERSGYPQAGIVGFSMASAIVLVLLVYGSAPAALCALMGLTIGPPAGAIMALPAAVLPPHRRAFGLGIFYTTYYGVMAVGPAMAGWCRDHWQTAAAAILFGAIAYLAIVPLFLLFKISAASARAP
ncbi:MAG TPA: MFS transporter [Stellaceae bacterium]|nr:MFS transporter [Stellaceae bacterium]